MKFLEPNFKVISNDNQLKNIEYFGRICYRSEEKITEDSYKNFIKSLIKRGHLAVTEHANYTFKCDDNFFNYNERLIELLNTPSIKVSKIDKGYLLIMNLRHIIELGYKGYSEFYNALDKDTRKTLDLNFEKKLLSNKDNKNLKLVENNTNDLNSFISIEFNIARGIWDELARHRIAGMNAESSRYCMYADDKFGNELKVAIPHWFKEASFIKKSFWKLNWKIKEFSYKICTKLFKMQAQQVRGLLGLDYYIKCGYTASADQWKKIMKLRLAKGAHPDIRNIMEKLCEELEKQNIKVR